MRPNVRAAPRTAASAALALLLAAAAPAASAAAPTYVAYANFAEDYFLSGAPVANGASGQIGIAPGRAQERTLEMQPPLASRMALDPDRAIEVYAYYSGEAFVAGAAPVFLAGQLEVSTRITAGSTVVAEGGPQEALLLPTGITVVHWSLPVAAAALDPADGNLAWYLREAGAASGALFMPDSGQGPWSRIEFPLLGGDTLVALPPIRFIDLPPGDAVVTLAVDTPGDGWSIHNWSAPAGPLRLELNASVAAGAVAVEVTGPAGHAFAESFTQDAARAAALDAPEAGAWNISVRHAAFQGSLSVRISAPGHGPAGQGGEGSDGGNAAPSGDGNGEGDGEGQGDGRSRGAQGEEGGAKGKKSPAPGGLPALGLLALAWAAARRR